VKGRDGGKARGRDSPFTDSDSRTRELARRERQMSQDRGRPPRYISSQSVRSNWYPPATYLHHLLRILLLLLFLRLRSLTRRSQRRLSRAHTRCTSRCARH